MIPKRWIEAYLRFLLRNRLAVSVVVAIMTIFFAAELRYIKVVPQFLDFYPGPSTVRLFGHEYTWRKGHPYITIYNTFRRMFGSANVLTVILEVKQGDIYNPTTLQKLDLILAVVARLPGADVERALEHLAAYEDRHREDRLVFVLLEVRELLEARIEVSS